MPCTAGSPRRPRRWARSRRSAPAATSRFAALAGAFMLLSAPPAPADAPPVAAGTPIAGALFALRVFDEVETGDRLVFRYERTTEPEDPRVPDFDGTATVTLTEVDDRAGREARVVLSAAEGPARAAPPLPEAAGHPLLVVFLENTVGTMAAATGGNPAYIRSRLREALWLDAEGEPAAVEVDGESRPARAIEVRPFAEDPARDEMGGFADLELRFVVSDEVPGRLALLQSRTEPDGGLPAITERITFDRLEERER
jgi:hypothetical protein